jgi:hypothetical protein
MEEIQCKNQERHEAHKWSTWSGHEVWCPGNWRPALMDDLAVLRLHLEDDLIHDTEAGEAFARVVGALDLSDVEETWLEEQ